MKAASDNRPRRIGIFGGTFDPPHVGHLIIAESARAQLNLDRVYFVPAFIPPHKRSRVNTPARLRLAMVKLAIRGNSKLEVSGREVRRKGVSYTVDTLKEFRRLFPRAELYLIVGADNLSGFESWKDPGTIRQLARIAVYVRGKYRKKGPRGVIVLRGPRIDISSSAIRKLVTKGQSARYLVPDSVWTFIRRHMLYV